MLGEIEGRRRRGWQRMRWLHDITDSMDMSLSHLQVMMKDREAWRAAIHGVPKSQTRLSDWTTILRKISAFLVYTISNIYILFICAGSQIKHFTHINFFNSLITILWIRHYFYSQFLNCGNQEDLLKTYINTHGCYSSFCDLSTESKFSSITLYSPMMHTITKGDVLELCEL